MSVIITVICILGVNNKIEGKVIDFEAKQEYNRGNKAINYWRIQTNDKDEHLVNENDCLIKERLKNGI